jgi:hypothetical protein
MHRRCWATGPHFPGPDLGGAKLVPAGDIHIEFWADCANCRRDERLPEVVNRSEAAAKLRAMHWQRINGVWLCPPCAGVELESAKPAV